MATAIRDEPKVSAEASNLTSEQVWREIADASFAVVSYVTPAGDPRSSGIVYTTIGRRLYFAVAPDGWKAKHIAASGKVSITVLVRRGGVLTLVAPIPPATISFAATATVHQAGSVDIRSMKELASLIPPGTVDKAAVIEASPVGAFLTYGIGIPLMKMRDEVGARARVPVAG